MCRLLCCQVNMKAPGRSPHCRRKVYQLAGGLVANKTPRWCPSGAYQSITGDVTEGRGHMLMHRVGRQAGQVGQADDDRTNVADDRGRRRCRGHACAAAGPMTAAQTLAPRTCRSSSSIVCRSRTAGWASGQCRGRQWTRLGAAPSADGQTRSEDGTAGHGIDAGNYIQGWGGPGRATTAAVRTQHLRGLQRICLGRRSGQDQIMKFARPAFVMQPVPGRRKRGTEGLGSRPMCKCVEDDDC